MPDLKLRMAYNSIASVYEKARPSYPENIIDLVLEFSNLKPGQNILDIGCGTGKGIYPFLKRGYSAHCIDIGEEMISEAKYVLSSFKKTAFEVVKFEDWYTNQSFDLIICASAFHWLEYNKRYWKIAQLLNKAGTLAVFRHENARQNSDFICQQEKIYRKNIPEWFESHYPESDLNSNQKESGLELFTIPVIEVFHWEKIYSADEYINLVSTYSGHINLPFEKRNKLLNEIKELIIKNFNGYISKEWKTELILRRKIS